MYLLIGIATAVLIILLLILFVNANIQKNELENEIRSNSTFQTQADYRIGIIEHPFKYKVGHSFKQEGVKGRFCIVSRTRNGTSAYIKRYSLYNCKTMQTIVINEGDITATGSRFEEVS